MVRFAFFTSWVMLVETAQPSNEKAIGAKAANQPQPMFCAGTVNISVVSGKGACQKMPMIPIPIKGMSLVMVAMFWKIPPKRNEK